MAPVKECCSSRREMLLLPSGKLFKFVREYYGHDKYLIPDGGQSPRRLTCFCFQRGKEEINKQHQCPSIIIQNFQLFCIRIPNLKFCSTQIQNFGGNSSTLSWIRVASPPPPANPAATSDRIACLISISITVTKPAFCFPSQVTWGFSN